MNIQFRCLSILLFSLFIFLHGCIKDKEQKKKPNVILILADDIGFHFCVFGSGATFTVVAENTDGCVISLQRNGAPSRVGC